MSKREQNLKLVKERKFSKGELEMVLATALSNSDTLAHENIVSFLDGAKQVFEDDKASKKK